MLLAILTNLMLLLHYLLFSLPLLPTSVYASPSPRARLNEPNQEPHPTPSSSSNSIGKIQTKPVTVYKPRSLALLHKTRLRSLQHSECLTQYDEQLVWDAVQVQGPNVEDRHTLAQLARMSGNAYALPGQKNWYDVDPAWNTSFPFGWDDSDGFRGHVFLSQDNNTLVLSIKGTTVSGPTSKLDRYNDNLLFSCCCGKNAWILHTVCDCYANRWRCDNQCLTDALVEDSLFYSVGTKLIDDLLHIYPSANIWLVGHSLGGALASLLGATYGLPAVAFESPGEKLAAQRLHLPLPPPTSSNYTSLSLSSTTVTTPSSKSLLSSLSSLSSSLSSSSILSAFFPAPRPPRPPPASPLSNSITHLYHTADPIPFGTCSGLYSVCASAGYALETRCHLGQSIILDTVNRLHWFVDVRKHVIREVVGLLDMPGEGEEGIDWGEAGDGDGDGDDDEGETPDPGDDPWFGRLGLEAIRRLSWKDLRVKLGLERLWGWRRNENNKDKDKDTPRKPVSNRVPKPVLEDDCVDCYKWEFGDFKDEALLP